MTPFEPLPRHRVSQAIRYLRMAQEKLEMAVLGDDGDLAEMKSSIQDALDLGEDIAVRLLLEGK
jgi:hypothetical protein